MPRFSRAVAALLATPVAAAGLALAAPATSAHAYGNQNNQIAHRYFIKKGLTPAQSAGIVGNLMQESGSPISPRAVQRRGPGRGIAQWSVGGRWNGRGHDTMSHYARSHRTSMYSLNAQLGFVWYELSNYPAYGLRQLRATHTVSGATTVFMRRYEMCGMCAQHQRVAYANRVLATYRHR